MTRVANAQGTRVAEKFLTYNEEERDWKPNVIWIHGPSGAGKSRLAREICGDADVYVKNTDSKWWDGYDGHESTIIDDFRDTWWSLTYMLGLLDRYPFRVEYKGGMRQFVSRTIIVTCIHAPNVMYNMANEDENQLLRRIDEIRHIVPDVPDVPEVGEG